MATTTLYRFPIAEATQLASLGSIELDLVGVRSYCQLITDRTKQGQLNAVEWEAIISAAIVRYARCFCTGVRAKLSDDIFAAATPVLLDDHRYVMDMRNKHVAHSVNAFEENDVVLLVDDEFVSAAQIEQVSTFHNWVIGPPSDMPLRLDALATWALERVRDLCNAEKLKILAAARALPLSTIRAYETAQLGASSSPSTASQRRRSP
jgi:hypothetical protein